MQASPVSGLKLSGSGADARSRVTAAVATTELESYEPVFVARQPIFTPELVVWGYELLFRRSRGAPEANVVDGHAATAQVIADGYALVQEEPVSDRKALINFSTRALLDGTARALPTDRVVIEILESVEPTSEVVDACWRLKAAGYLIALDDYVGSAGSEPLLALADIVKVDVLGMTAERIEEVVAQLQPHDCALLAEKVEERAAFEHTRELGFSFFQGYFFSKPEVVPGRKITSSQSSRLRLLRETSGAHLDIDALARIIASDPGLSHRLLRHLNSAAFGLRVPIQSIGQAAAYLGRSTLCHWLRVVLLSDLSATPGSEEATRIATQRARFLHELAGHARTGSESPDSLFMLGLLSLIDVMLGQPMPEVCRQLPLDRGHRAALCGEPSEAGVWLKLVRALERGEWDPALAMLEEVGVAPEAAAGLYAEAQIWANNAVP